MCSRNLDPMAQDKSPEQDIVMGELELPPQMDPEPEMGAAAAYDTSPPLHQNPPPIPAETARQSTLDMILQALNGMENEMKANARKLENKIDGMTQALRGEMRQVGQCLQAGKRAPPRAAMSELRGSAPAGEDRVIRETWRVTEKVMETVTQTLKGEETTCTRETRRQVTELTETREVEETEVEAQ